MTPNAGRAAGGETACGTARGGSSAPDPRVDLGRHHHRQVRTVQRHQVTCSPCFFTAPSRRVAAPSLFPRIHDLPRVCTSASSVLRTWTPPACNVLFPDWLLSFCVSLVTRSRGCTCQCSLLLITKEGVHPSPLLTRSMSVGSPVKGNPPGEKERRASVCNLTSTGQSITTDTTKSSYFFNTFCVPGPMQNTHLPQNFLE